MSTKNLATLSFSFLLYTLTITITNAQQSDWGTSGSWQILSSPTSTPPSFVYRKPTSSAGSLFVLTNNSLTSNMGVSQFDIINNIWTVLPDLPLTNPLLDPFMLEFAGIIVAIDELNPQNAVSLDAVSNNGWKSVTLPGYTTTSRFGQRFVQWGTLLYSFSGVDINTWTNHNDIWAVDFATSITTTTPASWVQLIGDNVVGSPPARVGYSFTDFGLGMVMYGGASIDAGGVDPDICFDPSSSSVCHFHDTVWAFTPGFRGANALIPPLSTSTWIKLPDSGVRPTGRFDHTAAAMSNQLFIYGGTTSTGTTSELWVYNLQTNIWAQVTQSSPSPSIFSDIGYGAGIGIGRHLLQFVQAIDSTGNPIANQGQLWMWSPSSSSSSGSSNQNSGCGNTSDRTGSIAAFVILILLAIANLTLLTLFFRSKVSSTQSLGDVYSLASSA